MTPGSSSAATAPAAASAAATPAPEAAASSGPALDVKTLEVAMPALSSTMTEGKIVEWTVKVGDKVKSGDTIMVVESDKVRSLVERGKGRRILYRGGASYHSPPTVNTYPPTPIF